MGILVETSNAWGINLDVTPLHRLLLESLSDKKIFEKLVREHDTISLIRLNLDQAMVPESFGNRAVGINADMAESIRDIVEGVD